MTFAALESLFFFGKHYDSFALLQRRKKIWENASGRGGGRRKGGGGEGGGRKVNPIAIEQGRHFCMALDAFTPLQHFHLAL